MSRDTIYNLVNERVLSFLDKGIIPWRKSWTHSRIKGVGIRNAITDIPYTGINTMLLFGQGELFLSLNQAVAYGGRVKREEILNSNPVIFWSVNINNKNEDPNDKDDEDPVDKALKKRFILRYYRVYSIDQCENVKLPVHRKLPGKEFQVMPSCLSVIDNYKDRPAITVGGNEAFYSPSFDTVQVPPGVSFKNPESFYATLYHELIHSTGHTKRLDRKLKGSFAGESYSKEELIAEIGASYLCTYAGINTDEVMDNSIAYLQEWIKELKKEPQLITHAAGAAQRAAEYVIGDLDA